MKMIVVTEHGKIQGFAHGSEADHSALHAGTSNAPACGLRVLPGQDLHEVDVPDEFEKILDGDELHERLRQMIKTH